LPPLIKSTSRSFRPVDAKFGPDGALYLCDWYNPIIGHYQASFRHPDRDKTHGRIWRVTAKGRPLTKPPQLADARISELLDHLKSSDRWTRHFAKRALADRPADQVTAALKEFVAKPGLSEHELKEALGVYKSQEMIAPELLARLCRSDNAGARAYAASVAGAWADRLPDPLALLRPLVADQNPRVRLQAVVACAGIPKSEAMEVVAIAADFPTDKFLSYALNQAVFALKPYWLPVFKLGKLNLENKQSRLDLLIRSDATPDTLQAVRELLQASKMDRELRERYLRLLAENGDASDVAAILTLNDAALQTRLFPVVASVARIRNVRPTEVAQAMRSLMDNQNSELRAEALKLAGVWKLEEFRPAAEVIALDATAQETVRRAAIEALASFGGDASQNALRRLARGDVPSVQGAAIAALCSVDLVLAARLAAASFDRLKDEVVLTDIFSAFLRRQGGADTLATELLTKAAPKYAAEVGLRLMSASGRRNERLAHNLTSAAGFDDSLGFALEEVTALAAEARANGDAKRGAEIFRRAELGCVACHAVNGQGGNIGPDLSALGTAQPMDFIIGAILDPQKEIKEGYVSTSVLTKGGDELQGYQVRETRDELVLRDVLQNKEVRLRRDTIKEKKQNGSVMPAGLVDPLTRTEFRDLVRFLSELGKPK
jgi:putative heme-binding domain-containing protein